MIPKRLYLVAKYIWQNADESHFVTKKNIQDYLISNNESPGDRETIGNDIDFLISAGMGIRVKDSTQKRYFLDNHIFSQAEIHLLKDAVQSSKFISAKDTQALIDKLSVFQSSFAKDSGVSYKYVEKYPKAENEKILGILDAIENAIAAKKKVTFQYTTCNLNKKTVLRRNGEFYKLSPYNTIWKDDNYYVIGYDETHNGIIGTYRIDRIRNISVTDEPMQAKPKTYSPAKYHKEVFSMRAGDTTTVRIRCENEIMQNLIERFGKDFPVDIVDDEHFDACITVSLSATFYAWIMSFGGKIKLIEPASAVEGFKELVGKLYE